MLPHVVAFGSEEQACSLLLSLSVIRCTECPRNALTYEPDPIITYYSQKSGLLRHLTLFNSTARAEFTAST